MAEYDFGAESPSNFTDKTLCCLLVDTSGSMDMNDAIGELNRGLKEFHQQIKDDPNTSTMLEIALIEFNSRVDVLVNPALADDFDMPHLKTAGTTQLVTGVREAMALVEARKTWYKETNQKYKRPWVILITDGAPDAGQDVYGLAKEIEAVTKAKKLVFLPIGVAGADMNVLQQISGYLHDNNKGWYQMGAMKLEGLKFHEFFQWLSASMELISGSSDNASVNLPTASDWTTGFKI